jgi:hypothetical protein
MAAGYAQVRANAAAAGVDHVTVEHYAKNLDANFRYEIRRSET